MAQHPWELTLRQFIEQVRRDYGVELRTTTVGNHQVLVRGSLTCALSGIGEDDTLAPNILRSLCKYFDLPPLDFALDPEDED